MKLTNMTVDEKSQFRCILHKARSVRESTQSTATKLITGVTANGCDQLYSKVSLTQWLRNVVIALSFRKPVVKVEEGERLSELETVLMRMLMHYTTLCPFAPTS